MMEIRGIFDQLITALETNDMNLLDGIFAADAKVVSSAHGELEGLAAIKAGLGWKGAELDCQKIRVFNNVLRSTDIYAYQYCYLTVLAGKEVNGFMNHFDCGFRLTVEYQKKENEWRITEVRANMVYESGNTLLAADHWNLIDYSKWEGYKTVIIDPREHSPWNRVPDSILEQTEEEAAAESFWHYNWLIDTDDFDTLRTICTDGVAQEAAGQKNKADFVGWLQGKREKWVEYNGVKMPKEACWSHISTIREIKAEGGDYVTADFYRVEPNRLGNKFLHKYNIDAVVYTAVWHMGFAKKDGRWLLDKWDYESISIEDCGQGSCRYF